MHGKILFSTISTELQPRKINKSVFIPSYTETFNAGSLVSKEEKELERMMKPKLKIKRENQK